MQEYFSTFFFLYRKMFLGYSEKFLGVRINYLGTIKNFLHQEVFFFCVYINMKHMNRNYYHKKNNSQIKQIGQSQ